MSKLIHRHGRRRGFTMIELLTVIGIIVILMSILIPVISRVRRAAQDTDTAAQLTKIAEACHNYYMDFRSYPGPFPDIAVHGYPDPTTMMPANLSQDMPVASKSFPAALQPTANNPPGVPPIGDITSSENLVLGLCGGLTLTGPAAITATIPYYDASLVPKGPQVLNPLAATLTPSYLNVTKYDLAQDGAGNYSSAALMGTATSAPLGTFLIPEFTDHYNHDPHPNAIIYLCARAGATAAVDVVPAAATAGAGASPGSQYFSAEMGPYAPNFFTQQDRYNNFQTAYPANTTGTNGYGSSFFANQALDNGSNTVPRGKDAFILISAGYDGIYGTKDDIIYPAN